MKTARILFTFTLLFYTALLCGKSKPQTLSRDFYNRWVLMSTADLMDRAKSYFTIPEKRDSALVWYSIVANRYGNDEYTEADYERAVGAMNNLGYMYFYFYQDYYKSYSYLQRGLKLSLEKGYTRNLPYLYLNLGNLYSISDEDSKHNLRHKRALDYYKKSFQTSIQTSTYDILCIVMSNMLSIAYNMEMMDSVSDEISLFNKTRIPNKTPLITYCRHQIRAYQLLSQHQYAEAIKECDLAIANVDDKNTPERFALTIQGLKAHIYSLQGDNESAFKLIAQMEKVGIEKEIPDFLVNIYREYSLYYKEIGKSELAHDYRVKYLELKDSLLTESNLKSVNDMQFLDELNTLNEQMAETQRQKHEQSIAMWGVMAVTVAIVALLIVVTVAYRRQRRANRHLYEKSLEALQREATERSLRHQLQEQLSRTESEAEAKPIHNQRQTIDEEETQRLLHKIESALDNVEVISNAELNLKHLAELIDEKYWTVSQVINNHYGKNFNALLGEYRINEACRRINDTGSYGQFTIEGIATSVGFKSRSNFVTVFKNVTGLTPSEYQRMAREKKSVE